MNIPLVFVCSCTGFVGVSINFVAERVSCVYGYKRGDKTVESSDMMCGCEVRLDQMRYDGSSVVFDGGLDWIGMGLCSMGMKVG